MKRGYVVENGNKLVDYFSMGNNIVKLEETATNRYIIRVFAAELLGEPANDTIPEINSLDAARIIFANRVGMICQGFLTKRALSLR